MQSLFRVTVTLFTLVASMVTPAFADQFVVFSARHEAATGQVVVVGSGFRANMRVVMNGVALANVSVGPNEMRAQAAALLQPGTYRMEVDRRNGSAHRFFLTVHPTGSGGGGTPGPMGPAGPMGPVGPVGAAGPAGPQGAAGTPGAVGAQGPAGPVGAAGPVGPAGAMGPAGPAGATGPAGAVGAMGPMGLMGPVGPAGATGAAGPMGPMGPTGLMGPVGPAGATGAMGPAGPTGATGATGAMGPVGPAGDMGPAGPAGPTGATGAMGPVGPTGATGATGAMGPAGPAGAMGPEGPAGATGAVGPAGPAGPQGTQGPQGEQGPAGVVAGLTVVASNGATLGTVMGFTIGAPTQVALQEQGVWLVGQFTQAGIVPALTYTLYTGANCTGDAFVAVDTNPAPLYRSLHVNEVTDTTAYYAGNPLQMRAFVSLSLMGQPDQCQPVSGGWADSLLAGPQRSFDLLRFPAPYSVR